MLIGDLLIQEGRTQDAITQYAVVAQAYSSRGKQPRRLVCTGGCAGFADGLIGSLPADRPAGCQWQVDEAIGEYLDLADIYYRLAELDMARKTYTTALRLANRAAPTAPGVSSSCSAWQILTCQHLDWRQAVRVFEQLRTLEPDDLSVRKKFDRTESSPESTAAGRCRTGKSRDAFGWRRPAR